MPEKYTPHPLWHGNLLCSIDLETTGVDPSNGAEVCQVAIIPLEKDYTPSKTIRHFVRFVRPENAPDPEATAVHGIDSAKLAVAPTRERVIDDLVEWVENIELAYQRRLLMLAHNASFEIRFLQAMLGVPLYDKLFNPAFRDSMATAITINDMAAWQGKKAPFERVSLPWLCDYFEVTNSLAHDAYYDALACAEVYRKLMAMDVLL